MYIATFAFNKLLHNIAMQNATNAAVKIATAAGNTDRDECLCVCWQCCIESSSSSVEWRRLAEICLEDRWPDCRDLDIHATDLQTGTEITHLSSTSILANSRPRVCNSHVHKLWTINYKLWTYVSVICSIVCSETNNQTFSSPGDLSMSSSSVNIIRLFRATWLRSQLNSSALTTAHPLDKHMLTINICPRQIDSNSNKN